MTNMPANSALTGANVTEGGFKTALDQAMDAIRERVEDGTTGMVTADLVPNTDAAEDLGTSTNRYRNLYLSGGLYLGGTTSANYLTDYEEGTWTPEIQFGGASVGVAYAVQNGTYTKIGRVVFFRATITLSAKGSSTGSAVITGLPFTVPASNPGVNVVSVLQGTVDLDVAGGRYSVIGQTTAGGTSVQLFQVGDNVAVAASAALTDANFANTSTIRINGFYFI